MVYDYHKANWFGLKEDFGMVPWDCIYFSSDIDEIWDAWKTLFFKAVEQNIPSRFLPRQCRNPWINPELKKSIRFGSKPRCQTILTNGCTKGLIMGYYI